MALTMRGVRIRLPSQVVVERSLKHQVTRFERPLNKVWPIAGPGQGGARLAEEPDPGVLRWIVSALGHQRLVAWWDAD
jgi:hypothetical protein